MTPELPIRMSETIDNVAMVKESAGDLSLMQLIDKLSGVGRRSTTAVTRWCWTRCGQARPDGVRPPRGCLRSGASTCTMLCLQANCKEHKPFTPNSSRCRSSV
jgi:hypothetical protein